MKIKKLSIVLLLLITSGKSLASYIEIINDTAQSTYHLSKYCTSELYQLKNESPDAWIGLTEHFEYTNGTYGFNYHVFHTSNGFETKEINVLNLVATPINSPMEDASSYVYNCARQK